MGGVKTDINRPIFPSVGGSPDAQRLVTAVNEVMTALLTSGALLGRVPPGEILRPKNGQVSLAWGQQNRVDVGASTGLAKLPAIRPELIGQPLYLSKLSPSGVVSVKASGKAADGVSTPLVDGSPTGIQRRAAGLSAFMTDGQNWYSTLSADSAAAGGVSPASASGAVGVIQLHDTTYNPVGLWQFQGDLNDSSGHGFSASVDAGELGYEVMAQRLLGARFNGLRLSGPSATLLALRNDMTIEFFGSFEDQGPVGSFAAVPAAGTTGIAISYTGGTSDVASDVNYLYQISFPDVRRIQWFSEHDVGVNDTFVPSQMVMPPPGQLFHCAAVRQNSRVQFYLNGAPYGTLSPSLFAPTDGANSRLWFGGVSGTGTPTVGNNFSLASVKLIATGLNADAVRGEYNRTLGPYLGVY
jgi:hypothetical protein